MPIVKNTKAIHAAPQRRQAPGSAVGIFLFETPTFALFPSQSLNAARCFAGPTIQPTLIDAEALHNIGSRKLTHWYVINSDSVFLLQRTDRLNEDWVWQFFEFQTARHMLSPVRRHFVRSVPDCDFDGHAFLFESLMLPAGWFATTLEILNGCREYPVRA